VWGGTDQQLYGIVGAARSWHLYRKVGDTLAPIETASTKRPLRGPQLAAVDADL